jgi:V/A-type H+/Na+-transporting ATPase subunit I
MFRPVPMILMSVVVLDRDRRAVLRALGELKVVHLMPATVEPGLERLHRRDKTQGLAVCHHLLGRIDKLQRTLEVSEATIDMQGEAEFNLEQGEKKLAVMERQAGELLKRRQDLLQRAGELSALCEQISKYSDLDLPLGDGGRFEFLHFVTGSLAAENLEQLKAGEKVALLTLPREGGQQPLIAITTRTRRQALEKSLDQAGFQRDRLPTMEGETTATLIKSRQSEEKRAMEELLQTNEQLRKLAVQAAKPLASFKRLTNVERRLLEAEQNLPGTEAVVLLSGWVTAARAPALEQRLSEITGGRCAINIRAAENVEEEQVPVLLRNVRWLRPFEMLVIAYGLPRYKELQPVLFVAISFVLMFGMMFGDAGQGMVLALGGLVALFMGHTQKVRDTGLLLIYGGISSIAFGIVYGSYFGLVQLKRYALWHDPLEGNPITLMYAAIGLGVVILSLGLILNIINRFWRGDIIGGFLDKFGVVGLMFYWGVLALIMKFTALQARGLANLALILLLGIPFVGWALKGPLEYALRRHRNHNGTAQPFRSLSTAITDSLVGIFEAVLSYLANTISFVRIAAYSMSHAALLVATFMVATEVQRSSIAGSVLIIIFGNLAAILLEGVIVSVQALRLEYYEFFSKFFSGAGKAFKPFQLEA